MLNVPLSVANVQPAEELLDANHAVLLS